MFEKTFAAEEGNIKDNSFPTLKKETLLKQSHRNRHPVISWMRQLESRPCSRQNIY